MKELQLCACGRVHVVALRLLGMPIVVCPDAHPETWGLLNVRLFAPGRVRVPRPEAVW